MASERLSCSICLAPLKDPVTLPCGHNYCMECIKGHWDGKETQRNYSCPQCREMFKQRPSLKVNFLLVELVEELEKMKVQAVPGDPAGSGDVACDVCTERKRKAIKSCLVCQASYCQEHLKPHHQSAAFKTHKLVEPCNEPQNICFTHGEVKKLFCRTDRQSVCHLCTTDQHRGHDIIRVAAVSAEQQKEVEESRRDIPHRVKEREEEVKLLQQQQDDINHSADEAVEQSQMIFSQLIRLLQERSDHVAQLLRSHQQSAVNGYRELQQKLQQEIEELKWIDVQLGQCSATEDGKQFLHCYTALAALCSSTHSSIVLTPHKYFEAVTAAVLEGAEKLQEILRVAWTNVPEITQPEPKTKAELLRYSTAITLDQNTVNNYLELSEGNRKVTRISQCKRYSRHFDRFNTSCQVLSRESLTERCYWEVEWRPGENPKGEVPVAVAVAYRDISREGENFGSSDKSWALISDKIGYTFFHKNIKTPVQGPLSSRVGVFLDHSAGTLSFYSVSTTLSLIHRVQTSFKQPLYAGFQIYQTEASAEIMKLLWNYRPPEKLQSGLGTTTSSVLS